MGESDLGERLRWIMRYSEGTTRGAQKRFAEALDVPKNTLGSWLSGTEPTWTLLRRIAERFPEVSVEWLVTGRGEPLAGSDSQAVAEGAGGYALASDADRRVLRLVRHGLAEWRDLVRELAELRARLDRLEDEDGSG